MKPATAMPAPRIATYAHWNTASPVGPDRSHPPMGDEIGGEGNPAGESPISPQTSENGSAQTSGAVPGNADGEPFPATRGHRPPPL